MSEKVTTREAIASKNVENLAIFVEGFWPEFYARGRFMKYSMSSILPNSLQFKLETSIWKVPTLIGEWIKTNRTEKIF